VPQQQPQQPWKRRIPFKVDIAGIIEIMGSALYSKITAPVRELIQNAHDAVLRRRQADLSYRGRIDVLQDAAAGTLTFVDDGIGLSEEEAERYLGTLGIGVTGMLRRGGGGASPGLAHADDATGLIGQFGVGLFSAFMLAERLVVQTRRAGDCPAVRWEAGPGTDIELSSCDRAEIGTAVTLHLKLEHKRFAEDEAALSAAIKEYADFIPVPIHVNRSAQRANLIFASWFEPTPDREQIELDLAEVFGESPLEVIPVRSERPAPIAGALYVTPARTPGFSGTPVVTAVIRRMVVSRNVQGLLPNWASFLRGVLELNACSPTASREDLVRDRAFDEARAALEDLLLGHLESLASENPGKLASILAWHRYTFAGAALTQPRLRAVLRKAYRFPTSAGQMSFDELLSASAADPLFEAEASHVIWFNVDRRQERLADSVFAGHAAPCVHAVRSFEESLLACFTADAMRDAVNTSGNADARVKDVARIDLRPVVPSSPGFAESVLGVTDLHPLDDVWQQFLAPGGAIRAFAGNFDPSVPVIAFLNERRELVKTFDELKKSGEVPASFQRIIDQHLGGSNGDKGDQNELLLNRRHPVVAKALAQPKTSHPLASVLRLLVINALAAAGATIDAETRHRQAADLDWIADALSARSRSAASDS
jgi:hypothetical protein